jgi:murein DD-endopeptidase MepM/ murein hydrolase activator NlpD
MRPRGGDPESSGPDLASIPGVGGGVALTVDRDRVPGHGRRRLRPAALALAGLIVVPALAATQLRGTPEPAAADASTTFRASSVPDAGDDAASNGPAAADTDTQAPPVFARFDGLDLHLPNQDIKLVGFHEASFDDALAFTPVGEAQANENRTKFDAPPADPAGPGYVVLSSRGRVHPATSAADIVMDDDTPVLSLVSGTVTDVRPYLLYGRYDDARIEIQPEGRPDLSVVLIHVRGVAVQAGDRLEAGVTRIAAGANRFPFASHIDRYLDPERFPHVHVEVKRR